jgi:hypothetical protein
MTNGIDMSWPLFAGGTIGGVLASYGGTLRPSGEPKTLFYVNTPNHSERKPGHVSHLDSDAIRRPIVWVGVC